jgi:hypothetical protein
MFDDRDNIYYSMKGRYLELVYHNQSGLTGSNFYYDRYRFDYRQFISLNTRQCLALQAFGDFIRGDVPFNQMPGIGAGKRGRGFYEGRFRDKNIILFQGELRNKLNDRWATAAFFSYALLSHEFGHISLSRDHLAAGLGLRYAFDPVHRTNIRLDIAFPIGGNDFIYAPDGVMKIYLAVNEAF